MFCLFFYFYLIQFICLFYKSYIYYVVNIFFFGVNSVYGFDVKYPLSSLIIGLYFVFILSLCYFGNFSWNFALGRVVEFVFLLALVSWFLVVLIFISEEIRSNIVGLYGEKYTVVLYSLWGKIISVIVRPLSLTLRLVINLTIGHFIILIVVFSDIFMIYVVLFFVVIYEFFVFFLQSFIFSRLLGVYLEECYYSIISTVVLRSASEKLTFNKFLKSSKLYLGGTHLFLLIFFFVFVIGLFFIVVRIFNIVVWWRVFILMDLIFIFLCKNSSKFSRVLNYFVFQEFLGFIFLFLTSSILQGVIVIRKIGILPFHYWVFVVMDGLRGWIVIWFLTLQKLPLIGVYIYLLVGELLYVLVFGFIMCYFQLFVIKDYKLILMLVSSERFNWIIIGYIFSILRGLIIFFYYVFMSLFIIPIFNQLSMVNYEWLAIITYLNVPLGVSFFVKIFSLFVVVKVLGFWLVVLLFMIFINFMSLLVWLIEKSLKVLIFDSIFFYCFFFNL